MASFINTWANAVVNGRLYVLIAAASLVLLALLTGKPIPFDNTTERYFVDGDPTLDDFDRLLDLFGDNEYLIIGIEAGASDADVFEPATVAAISALSDFLESHQYVTQVRSVTNYQYTHADGDDISTDYLIEDVDELANNPAGRDRVRSIIAGEELALGTLITADFRHTRLTARVEYRNDTAEHKIQLMEDVFTFIDQQNLTSGSFTIHLSGQPFLSERFEQIAQNDTSTLIPIMSLLMLLMLYLNFRSLVTTILPWVVIGAGILFVAEIQGYLGLPHTTVDRALNPTLIIIGIGISVHVLVEFFHFMKNQTDSKEAARLTIQHLWTPAFFTAFTTAAGFAALSVTKILPVRDFALLGAIGPLVLFILALTVLPALLSYLSHVTGRTHEAMASGFVHRITLKIPDFTYTYRKPILGLGVIMLMIALFAIPSIRIDTNYIQLFRQNSEVRQDIAYFDDTFKGVMLMDVILDSGAVDGVKEPAFLQQLESFQAWLETREAIGPVNSLTDYLKQISQALNGDDPAYYRLPTSKEMSAQFLLLYDSSGANEDLSDIKDFDDRYARITMPIVNMQASLAAAELTAIEEELASNYSHLNPLFTGGMVLFTAQDIYTSEGMARSFIIALIVMCLVFVLLFRSLKYGLLSLIPSVVPILITGGVAGLSGIYLDLSTTIVGAMTMGIAVDDAIHVMNRYLLAKRQGADTKQAIARAMNESGRAVIFSSIVLVLGFTVLTAASFVPIALIGFFGAIIMALALLGDLLFLPAILYTLDGYKEHDSLSSATDSRVYQSQQSTNNDLSPAAVAAKQNNLITNELEV